LSSTVDFTWGTPGTKTITVTADNGYGTPVTTTHTINITNPEKPPEPQAVTTAAIAGQSEGTTNTTIPFTITVEPTTAATPITYTWQATGQDTVSHTGALSSTVDFTWDTPGTKAITVTADNGYGAPVTTTHTINITNPEKPPEPQAVTTAAIAGQSEGTTNTTIPFTTTVGPVTASTPITYTWQATDHDPITHTGEQSDTVDFTWAIAGTKAITVTADNGYGEPVITTHSISIRDEDPVGQMLYLPLVTR
jgi:hypothetical protein